MVPLPLASPPAPYTPDRATLDITSPCSTKVCSAGWGEAEVWAGGLVLAGGRGAGAASLPAMVASSGGRGSLPQTSSATMSCMFERMLALATVAREAAVAREAGVVGAATGGWSVLASTVVAATGVSVGGAVPSSTGAVASAAGAARGVGCNNVVEVWHCCGHGHVCKCIVNVSDGCLFGRARKPTTNLLRDDVSHVRADAGAGGGQARYAVTPLLA